MNTRAGRIPGNQHKVRTRMGMDVVGKAPRSEREDKKA